MTDLKPCPFCGSKAEAKDGYPLAMVRCQECGGRLLGKTISRAVQAWNQRSDSARTPEGQKDG